MTQVLVGGKKREEVLLAYKNRLEQTVLDDLRERNQSQPTRFGILHDLEIEINSAGMMNYQASMDTLHQRGYDRHILPSEAMEIIRGFMRKKRKKPAPDEKKVYTDLSNGGEWLDLAVERRGKVLHFYGHPRNLTYDAFTKGYDASAMEYEFNQNFTFSTQSWESFGIHQKNEGSIPFDQLHRHNPSLIAFLWGPLEHRPTKISETANLMLPPEGVIHPACLSTRAHGKYGINFWYREGISRGVREVKNP